MNVQRETPSLRSDLPVDLPDGWTLGWKSREEEAAAEAIWLDLSTVAAGFDGLATAFWAERKAPGTTRSLPLGRSAICVNEFPLLDEVWTLWLMAAAERGIAFDPAWEAMCRYTADVRQQLWPDRLPPERTVQALYRSLVHRHLDRNPPQRDRFLQEALELCRHVAARLSAGARLLDDDLFDGATRFDDDLLLLAADRDLYREDWNRAAKYMARVRTGGGERRLPFIAIRQPVSTQFKLWAHRDSEHAPEAGGYPLLLIEHTDGEVTMYADPLSRVDLAPLAHTLSERETALGHEGQWYDGSKHAGALITPPRGSRLSFDEVLACLRRELRLRPMRNRLALPAKVAAAVVAIVVLAAGVSRIFTTPALEPAPAAKGEPLTSSAVVNLLASADGPRSIRRFAVIAGVCRYDDAHRLDFPCQDARAVRDLLLKHYGYRREDIRFLVDDAEARQSGGRSLPSDSDGVPTANNLRLVVDQLGKDIRALEAANANLRTSFLFYYSGHGGYLKGAKHDLGVLQPSGFYELEGQMAIKDRGWDMQRLMPDISETYVSSKHVMLLIDSCYSGWTGAKGGPSLDARVLSLWGEKAEVALTAGTSAQQSWEDPRWGGHSAFASALLSGLSPTRDGRVAADENRDGIVTDEELALHLKRVVPHTVAAVKGASQEPQFFRFDDYFPQRGQFLFVPVRG